MILLTNKAVTNHQDIQTYKTVSSIIDRLPKTLANPALSDIVLPIESCMNMVLDKSTKNFRPFRLELVYIRGIREKIVYLSSLQRPKRVVFIGSDGNDYIMLLKPKDDLRKDFRLMEFNTVVKQHLREDPESRQRRLNIRTYAGMYF
jgi:serine/threonine-protein kinase ATR